MEEVAVAAWAGVDTHRDTNTLALIDALGRVIGTWEFRTGREGYDELASKIGDASVPVGVEGTGSYGAGVAERLRELGYKVYEVIRPRRQQRRRGKSDPIDAVAAARNLAAGEGLAPKMREGAGGDIRWLMLAREHAVRHSTATVNAVKAMLVTAPDRVRRKYSGMPVPTLMAALAASRPSDACQKALRRLARRWIGAKKEADELELEIRDLVEKSFPALYGAFGVGAITAARLIVAAGTNPGRMGSEAAFSMLCGTSPIPASSGRTDRHRLNRGGNRQANRAIHEIALVRMGKDPRTKAYIAKKMAEGKTKREALRCVCRYIAREVYRLMTMPQTPPPNPLGLASGRKRLGMSQQTIANELGTSPEQISRIERGKVFCLQTMLEYETLLRKLAAKGENGY